MVEKRPKIKHVNGPTTDWTLTKLSKIQFCKRSLNLDWKLTSYRQKGIIFTMKKQAEYNRYCVDNGRTWCRGFSGRRPTAGHSSTTLWLLLLDFEYWEVLLGRSPPLHWCAFGPTKEQKANQLILFQNQDRISEKDISYPLRFPTIFPKEFCTCPGIEF